METAGRACDESIQIKSTRVWKNAPVRSMLNHERESTIAAVANSNLGQFMIEMEKMTRQMDQFQVGIAKKGTEAK